VRDGNPQIQKRIGTYDEAGAHFEHVKALGCEHNPVEVGGVLLIAFCPRCANAAPNITAVTTPDHEADHND
jgi:hypothetical protein